MTRKRPKPPEASPARGQLDLFNRAESLSSTALDGGEAAAGISDDGASAAVGPSAAGRLTPPEGAMHGAPLDKGPRKSSEVPRQAAGIPYQILYGIVKSLDLRRGETLGIEHLEDVSIRGPDRDIRIQVKNETDPLNDLDKGLWVSLANWARVVAAKPTGSVGTPKFVFATTAPITDSFPQALLKNLNPSERAVESIVEMLPRFSSEAPKVRDAIATVRALDRAGLMKLFWNVRVERAPDTLTLWEAMKEKLSDKSFPNASLQQSAEALAGSLNFTVLTMLEEGIGAQISHEHVRRVIEDQRSGIARSTITPRYMKLDPPEDERTVHRTRVFYRQLEVIGLPRQACDLAILDYVRNSKERHDWIDFVEVGRDELARYDNDLVENWRHDSLDVAGKRSSNKEESGRELYDSIMKRHSPQLRGVEPPGYVYRGSYHGLADAAPPTIGWHPDWEKHFGTQTAENDVADSTSGVSDE